MSRVKECWYLKIGADIGFATGSASQNGLTCHPVNGIDTISTYRLGYNGVLLDEEDTPQTVEMPEDAVLEVFHRPAARHNVLPPACNVVGPTAFLASHSPPPAASDAAESPGSYLFGSSMSTTLDAGNAEAQADTAGLSNKTTSIEMQVLS